MAKSDHFQQLISILTPHDVMNSYGKGGKTPTVWKTTFLIKNIWQLGPRGYCSRFTDP